jgi:hypothetical protein
MTYTLARRCLKRVVVAKSITLIEGITGQNRKNYLAAEKLSSPLNRPFSSKMLIRMEI